MHTDTHTLMHTANQMFYPFKIPREHDLHD